MGKVRKKLKKIRIHHEETDTLLCRGIGLVLIALTLWFAILTGIPFWIFTVVFSTVYSIVLNFYQCPIRYFGSGDTEDIVVAPADDRIVIIEEVDENKCFHERRLVISIFMSLWNVHTNWSPVDGVVESVQHFDGSFRKTWPPRASEENEHADTVITTPNGTDILCRQTTGTIARRIVTYVKPGEDCYIGEHLGSIKLGSRVDIFLSVGSEVCVKMRQTTMGDRAVIAKSKPNNK